MDLTVHRHILTRFSNCKGIKSSNSLKFRREAFCFLGDAGPGDSDPQGMQPGEQTAINFDKSSPSLVLGKYSVGKKKHVVSSRLRRQMRRHLGAIYVFFWAPCRSISVILSVV